MAQYLSLEGLQKYDTKIKAWAKQQDAEAINQAISALINSAPEEFDTLKEVSDWIQGQKEINTKISKRLEEFDNIERISDVEIDTLFLTPITITENQSISDAIGTLQEGQKLVLEEEIINENININNDCVIEAEGVTFTGTINIAQNVNATIIGAVFTSEVIVA